MVDTNELKKAKALWQTHRLSFILNDGLIFLLLKVVFAKDERGYRLNAIKKRI